ncbi:hypothetical protein [Hydrogenovibrio kuenenii]|uniref:hypothetical protein n=1 Tax=Hydrogenovibrio kuenenii TaxID=63658 RepID=UPI000466F1FE|nr:hypothetical protein [Hydrogenovibrio kuenenii]
MKRLTISVLLLIGFLAFQGVAEAASISTRVRILESKTYKLGKEVRQQQKENAAQSAKLDRGLHEIHTLKRKVEKFMQDSASKHKSQQIDPSNRYSFP